MSHPTKQRLVDAGLAMLLERGYNDLGVQALLDATGTPKGSFYHHQPRGEPRGLIVQEAAPGEFVEQGGHRRVGHWSEEPQRRLRVQ